MMNIKLLSLISLSMVLSACGSSTTPVGPRLIEITIEDQPTKTTYVVGDYFEPAGLSIKAIFNKGEPETVIYEGNESYFSFTPSLDTQLQVTDEQVTVEYRNFTATIDITVNEEIIEYETLDVDFSEYQFAGSSKEYSTTSSGFNSGFAAFVNEQFEEEIVSSVTTTPYVGLKKFTFDARTGLEGFNALQISSGSLVGDLTFTFSKKLVSIEISAQAYYNAFYKTWELEDGQDPYTCYSIDLDTTLVVNDEEWVLPQVEYDDNQQSYVMPAKATKSFNINSYTLTIADDDYLGRFFIHNASFKFAK